MVAPCKRCVWAHLQDILCSIMESGVLVGPDVVEQVEDTDVQSCFHREFTKQEVE